MQVSDLVDMQRRVLRWAGGTERIDRINEEVVGAIVELELNGFIVWNGTGKPTLTPEGEALIAGQI